MTIRALIVDDDSHIIQTVGDIVRSMDHIADTAGDVTTARALLEKYTYDYLLLDMNIPLSPEHRYGRRENGRNLLEIIRKQPRTQELPVIVITGEDKGQADFILLVVDIGGRARTEYIQKPLDGDKVDKKIKDMLNKKANPGKMIRTECQAFQSEGERKLIISPEQITLCGVWIVGTANMTLARSILDLLAETDANGNPIRLTGPQIQERLQPQEINPDTISGAIRDLRLRITEVLRKEANLIVGEEDVIESAKRGQPGYRLSKNIKIVKKEDAVESGLEETNSTPASIPSTPVGSPVANTKPSNLTPEQQNIFDLLRDRDQCSATEVREALKCSDRTASRRLAELRDLGLIHYVGTSRKGHWKCL